MPFTIIVMTLLVIFMLAGVFPSPGGMQAAVFRTPVFMILLGLLTGALLWCAGKREPGTLRIASRLLHLGVVFLLAGALLGFVKGEKGSICLPLTAKHVLRKFTSEYDKVVTLDFGVSSQKFKVVYYDPEYRLYRTPTDSAEGRQRPLASACLNRKGVYDFGRHAGTIPASRLQDATTKEWLPRLALEDGLVLIMAPLTPRRYEAELCITEADGKMLEKPLSVNHPVDYGGWRFYLTSYDTERMRYIVVTAKRKPGLSVVTAGIWMMIVGTAMVCFRKREVGNASF